MDLKNFPTLKSDRFDLIEINESHIEDIFKLYSDYTVVKHVDILPLKTLEEAKKEIEFYRERFVSKTGIRWGIAFKEQTKIIGTVGFNKVYVGHKGRIGYDLEQKYWGKGYMTEVLDCIISYGFKKFDLRRVEAEVTPDNIGSEKLLEKLNFRKEGVLREWMRWNDNFYEIAMYSLLSSDFTNKSVVGI